VKKLLVLSPGRQVQLVRELGGSVVVEPIDFTFGRMVEVADPYGARFLLTTF